MKNLFIKILVAITYIAMIFVNFLANDLPINNRSTGQISDDYPNLFAPAGYAFSIWGLIYLLLGAYIVYQFINKNKKTKELINKINPLFIGTSLANISWIFAWHYDYIGISVLIMAVLLILLIKIADTLRPAKLNTQEKLLIKTPFSIYFGWITVATIANVTVFLVSIGWNGFGIADYIWTSIILVVGAIIGILRLLKDKNTAYGLVLVWAYSAILYKHWSSTGFNFDYPNVIYTVIACIIFFIIFLGRNIYLQRNQ
ncbi:MAG: tryptophan-rich sensory protein [Candidatus Gracilibacteria bacterium]|jgi:hypothetical protein|nr:tryptophan-rich sensory protein [Candidatus Gracilibacteria bacterium]